ncbi:MAG: DUF4258 domain-containing protein [Chitinophagaceae bacterium]|nr:DUF4258 domain-containing protein [Chitinophagaceae bacterium]
MKKALPYILIALMLVAAVVIRQCRSSNSQLTDKEKEQRIKKTDANDDAGNKTDNEKAGPDVFRDANAGYYLTKHAKCRMKCRHITLDEIKEIVQRADVNYKKSELDAPEGPRYALEGVTSAEKQHVRIIVAPKKRHLTIVTVIDLENEWECPSCK